MSPYYKIATLPVFDHSRTPGFTAHCEVHVWRNQPGAHIFVLVEPKDNRGRSVTNAWEELATDLLNIFQLVPTQVAHWIEAYESDLAGPDSIFAQVGLSWQVRIGKWEAGHPTWINLSPKAIFELLGTDWREANDAPIEKWLQEENHE